MQPVILNISLYDKRNGPRSATRCCLLPGAPSPVPRSWLPRTW